MQAARPVQETASESAADNTGLCNYLIVQLYAIQPVAVVTGKLLCGVAMCGVAVFQ